MNTISLSTLDTIILLLYFLGTLGLGFYLSKKASRSISDYFLGGRKIPWWAIGMSGTASNFDMTGTMVMISFLFAIGLQGFWVALRGGMALYMAIIMIYMGKWLQRSNVMTTAEWMELRFGSGLAGKLARLLSAVANLIVTIALLVYFVEGGGKFLAVYLPFSPTVCALLMMIVALTYTTMSGFYGVIYTDVIQEVLILLVALYVGYQAFTLPDHAAVIASATYPGWHSLIPNWEAAPMNWLANPTVYQSFGLCILFWFSRSMFEGMGGFTGGYTPQRFYATKNEREVGLLTAEWILLLLFRWMLVVGTVILGLKLASGNPAIASILSQDPEQTLPVVLSQAIPSGLRGLLIAGLIAAAMSTFDSTINAGVSYWIRDIYQLYLKPQASEKRLIRQSYGATIALAAIAIILSQTVQNINEIWSWITGSLSAGLAAPTVLRWYWWRFNGYGFAIATAVGLVTSLLLKILHPELAFYVSFPLTLGISMLAGVGMAYLTPPTELKTLKNFWLRIRPFGFWRRVTSELDPAIVNKSQIQNSHDLRNVFLALIWQLSGVVMVMSGLLHQWLTALGAIATFIIFSTLLYFQWYKRLPTEQAAPK
ncbi:Na+/proline symporter [Xenococcus sp. PCC 7305]|uniref:sodium:solute symporter family transporter n=1 Tax=Xenococcus sp. PCC 7305 TaxID=102125 RepID=UPI0002ACC346|nr:Na+/proline symporter [Xenococcus sp. PCC 7305]ELS04600.1 Na+/proline symporter [Xenococcus sp. PCC 7305]